MIRTIILAPSCLPRQSRRIEKCTYSLTLKGEGHVVTQVGHIAYESMHIDERNTMRPLPRLYLFESSQLCIKSAYGIIDESV